MFEPEIVEASDTRFETKKEIITYLGQKAGHTKKIKNIRSYADATLDRESTASTTVGFGIVIPHGESNVVTETFIACLHLLYPVQQGHDGVDLIFMIGVPLFSRNREHLRILAMLS